MKNTIQDRITIIPRRLIKDSRGWFLKAISGTEENLPLYTGEIYFTSAVPGQTKGSHYHKLAQEWFTIISGKAILKLEDIYTHEKINVELDAENPVTVFIPSFIAHEVINSFEKDFILCAYTDILFDPNDTISYKIR